MQRSSAKVAKAPRELRAGSDLVGRSVGVPTTFFGVETDGARYLAKVPMLHRPRDSGRLYATLQPCHSDT